ncbi:TonB-dependent receptor [Denitratisoma sp. DHT3]|uniref:TonB-dependent receptor n=1 Tax=Denitratisoma sp. DHT3 TaxID=1981880 RepID=UPI0011984112|nr:TonB-dependent receptor [Denitratisoma sp. DHT3]QDX82632.1 TonB-dependent receptor [Denitratisoma sp. DHT3]
MKQRTLAVLLAALPALPLVSMAQEAKKLSPLVITAPAADSQSPGGVPVDGQGLRSLRAATSDTASLLTDVPGVSLYGAGGVSSLPAIHGLADDRLRIKVDGMDLIASCPNHMNPALSYVDPTNVGNIKVYAGISPVSVGGDSIGGSIIVETSAPKFAAPGQGSLLEGEVGAFYRSNGNASGANLSMTYATDSFNISYSGASAKSDNYKAGGDYRNFAVTAATNPANAAAGVPYLRKLGSTEVGSTAYETRNHTLGVAFKGGDHLIEAKLGYQDMPYQLYPNQRMDMLNNEQLRLNLRYLGQFGWGNLEARAYHEKVDHFMDFGQDKLYSYGKLLNLYPVNGMPMYTKGKTNGASAKADIGLNPRDLLRLGAEWQTYRLDDWWPPAPDCGYTGAVANCTGGMAPDTFWNVRNGKRDRMAIYGEWEAAWSAAWQTLAGLRYERVKTDSDDIQGYNTGMMYASSVVGTRQAWNDLDRKRADNNVDVTLLARNTVDSHKTFEYGFAQKTRSPNLYERSPWSTNSMVMEMNNFVGDGNGYVGNPDLKPEVARTLSITGDWHSEDRSYELKITPYYTAVKDYIDAVRRPTSGTDQNATRTTGFVKLSYANQTARLYGIDISGRMPLGKTGIGDFGLKGLLNYTNGKNTDTGDDLYNIMPLNTKLALTHQSGSWSNSAELVAVKSKNDVSDVRNEIKTPGYSLINLRGSYSMQKLRFDFGIENLFDRKYYLPLGGAYVGEGATMSLNNEAGIVRPANPGVGGSYGTSGSASMWGTAVPGLGRTFYAGITYKF